MGHCVAAGSVCRPHGGAASNLSLWPAPPTRPLSGSPPGPRQPPFGAGHQALSTGLWLPLAFRRVAFASWAFLCPLRAWAVLPKIVLLTGTWQDRLRVTLYRPSYRHACDSGLYYSVYG